MEGTLEPCHLHLVLSTCLIALVVVAVNQRTKLLDMKLGEGDKAQKCLPYGSTTRVLRILEWELYFDLYHYVQEYPKITNPIYLESVNTLSDSLCYIIFYRSEPI